jgi:hypothetical protein
VLTWSPSTAEFDPPVTPRSQFLIVPESCGASGTLDAFKEELPVNIMS